MLSAWKGVEPLEKYGAHPGPVNLLADTDWISAPVMKSRKTILDDVTSSGEKSHVTF